MFKYVNSMERNYDSSTKNVTSIRFSVGRYCVLTSMISFKTAVTELYAIRRVENYLSQPLSVESYNKLFDKGDLFGTDRLEYKYEALGDNIHLEEITYDGGALFLACGS